MPTDGEVPAPERAVTRTQSIGRAGDFVLAGAVRELPAAPYAISREPERVSSQAPLDLESAFWAKGVVQNLQQGLGSDLVPHRSTDAL